MHQVARILAAIKEDRRSSYSFDTKVAARALGIGENRVGEYWERTRRKLTDLCMVQPGEMAAEFMSIICQAEAERQAIQKQDQDSRDSRDS